MKKYFVAFNQWAVNHLYERFDIDNIPPLDTIMIYITGREDDPFGYVNVYFKGMSSGGECRFQTTYGIANHQCSTRLMIYDRGEAVGNKFFTGQELTEEEYYKIMHPYPKEVEDIVELMKKFGEFWKDDCDETHLDDVKMYPCAIEIMNYFKPKDNVKDNIKETVESKPINIETESFDQIVKKRKENGQFIKPTFTRRRVNSPLG
jgi:hypothetical protein